MGKLAIIGGTGLISFNAMNIAESKFIDTPYGNPSGPLMHGKIAGNKIIILCRHGNNHSIPPHKINYRANIWALHNIGVTHVIASASVGGINKNAPPQKIIIPDQIIDYTYSRKHTFFENDSDGVKHVDFTNPYCDELRENLLNAANEINLNVCENGTYGATQGPRLESAAEVIRMERDGCDIVGMTGMPETVLAKELGVCYSTLALSANWAAGKSDKELSINEIRKTIENGMYSVNQLLSMTVNNFYNK